MKYNDFEEKIKVNEINLEEELQKNELEKGNVFNSTIEKISECNGITTVLVKGLETNDINYR